MEITAQYVAIQRGQRPQPWVEGMSADTRRTEVFFILNPLDESGLERLVERKVLAESGEFTRIVWPSLRDLGVKTLRDANGKWAKITMVPSGRTWTNKEGQEVKGTTIKFAAIFDTQAECVAAWEQEFGNEAHARSDDDVPFDAPGNDTERETALQFLPALVKSANGDRAMLATLLSGMPMIAKFFNVDSPEVQALMQKETA
jgi:hypothetical protein